MAERFQAKGRSYRITDPWFDGNGKPHQSLEVWTDNGWQHIISATKVTRNVYGRTRYTYWQGDVEEHLRQKAYER